MADHTFIEKIRPTGIKLASEAIQKASDALRSSELPSTRKESWKYTRVAKLGKRSFEQSDAELSTIQDYAIDNCLATCVFVNGRFNSELSSITEQNGLTIQALSQLESIQTENLIEVEDELFHAINTAHLDDGLFIDVAKGICLEQAIHIIHYMDGDNTMANFRTIASVAESSQASIVQSFVSSNNSAGFLNTTAEYHVAANAVLKVDKLQNESNEQTHLSTEEVRQEKDSIFTVNTITLGGSLIRNNLNIEVNGQNCETNLNGAYILKDRQHVDNHTTVDHKVANCNSNELYKGVVDGKATAVFNGKVFVRQDAQKINAFQSNGNVLLSDDASVNSKPELEIYADDVRCSHGSTTGQLDEEAIFYLRARGLSESSARKLMVTAFISEVLEKIENEALEIYLKRELLDRHGLMLDQFVNF